MTTDHDNLGRGQSTLGNGELSGGTRTLSPDDQLFLKELQEDFPQRPVALVFAGDGSLDREKMLDAASAPADPGKPPAGSDGSNENPAHAPTPNKQDGHTGIHAITYPCGCEAKGQGNLPEHCPEHPEQRIEVLRDGHGNTFDAETHATNPHDGSPKTDSSGKFIRKEHDYAGPPPNKFFGD